MKRDHVVLGSYEFSFSSYVIKLIKECNYPLANITFVGHSLGAHVSAFAAKIIKQLGYGIVPRLIGLDPAAPLFERNSCQNRFCKTDATYVIVFHTSPLGIADPIGDLDLQFNGGKFQPGCSKINYYI